LDVHRRVSGHSHNVSQKIGTDPAELVLQGDDFGVLEGMINHIGLTKRTGRLTSPHGRRYISGVVERGDSPVSTAVQSAAVGPASFADKTTSLALEEISS
jgi:hypothetical protein